MKDVRLFDIEQQKFTWNS